MDCPSCGTTNTPTAKFCVECGTTMATACPSCGTPAPPGTKFCAECGTRIGGGGSSTASDTAPAVAAPALADAPVAERRLVSVLFADLVGFTTLSEHRDPEETRELLTRYFETARTVIDRYGGTVEKFIGDAVMAVWGTPITHEDDAERAVRSALELVEAVRVLGEEAGAPGLQARAGVLTGEAAVTIGASNQGMVAGDLVNTAARLQSAAEPGTVLVGEATHHATSSSIGYEAAGQHDMKGKAEPVAAFRATRVISKRRGEGKVEQLEAPFTGRQAELRMLKDFLHATGAEQRARVVSVMGQGGIGKSRLAWELLKYIDGLSEDVYWHSGRCPAYGEGVSFWALGEMIRIRAGIIEGETPESAGAKLTASIESFVADESERRWIEPALRGLLGLSSSRDGDPQQQETLFAAWRTYFERIAEKGTTVLVFEDLQWADAGLLDFIEHLLEWSRNRPLFIVTLARPELLDRRSSWGAGWRNFTSIVLEPLGDPAMAELLEGLVPGLPDSVVGRILARAEGVPLYAVETVRMLMAEGRIERDAGGVYRPVGDLTKLAVPETLQGLVSARLDGLPAEDRALVQEASVLGKTFTLAAVSDVSASDASTMEARLRDLVRRELFVLDADRRSPERGQYGFVQAIVREVAYGTLARRDRRRLHLAAARHFEQSADEELAGVLATHYLAAYRAHPDGPEGEAVGSQARLALRSASERATRLGSHDVALGYLEQALEVARDDRDRIDLHLAAGVAAMHLTREAPAEEHLAAAIELARSEKDEAAELRGLVGQGHMRLTLGHSDSAVEPLEDAAQRFAHLDGTADFADLAEALSRMYMRTLRPDDSLAWADRGLRISEQLQQTRTTLELLVTRATVLSTVGRLKESAATLIGARQLASAEGHVDIEIRSLINLGFSVSPDDPRVAYQASVDGSELAMRMGMRGYLGYIVGNAAENGLGLGAWAQVEDLLDRALAIELGDGPNAYLRSWKAILSSMRGQPYQDDVDALIATTPTDDMQARGALVDVQARIDLYEGRYERTIEGLFEAIREFGGAAVPGLAMFGGRAAQWKRQPDRLSEILAKFEDTPGRGVAAFRAELLAGLRALSGDRPGAVRGFLEALRLFDELGLEVERAMCQVSMVATLGSGPDTAEAEAEARATFERLGAARLIERLEALRGAPRPAITGATTTASEERIGQTTR